MSPVEISPALVSSQIAAQEGRVSQLQSVINKFEQLSGPFNGALKGAAGTRLQGALQQLVEGFRKTAQNESSLLDADRNSLTSLTAQDEANSQGFNVTG